jgi:hypothetical protein
MLSVASVFLALAFAFSLWRSIAALLGRLWSLHLYALTDARPADQGVAVIELVIGWPVIIAAKASPVVQLDHFITLLTYSIHICKRCG